MTTVTADLFQALNNLSDTDISNTNAEYVIQQGIDHLTTYGASLPSSTGAAGSKEWAATGEQSGAILEAARLTYYAYYKGQESVVISGISTNIPNMLTNPSVEEQFKLLAFQLKGRSFERV